MKCRRMSEDERMRKNEGGRGECRRRSEDERMRENEGDRGSIRELGRVRE